MSSGKITALMSPDDMTLGEAIDWLRREPFACACIGGSWCCMRRTEQAERLQRGAHITVRLLAGAGRLDRS